MRSEDDSSAAESEDEEEEEEEEDDADERYAQYTKMAGVKRVAKPESSEPKRPRVEPEPAPEAPVVSE